MTTWVEAKGFEGYYEVSDDGQVRRIAPYRTTKVGKVLKHFLRVGYPSVNLSIDGVRYERKIHRLVAESFGVDGVGDYVRHLDDNRQNNTVANLAWGDAKDNSDDAIRNGVFVPRGYPVRPYCKNGHLFTPENTFERAPGSGRGCKACRREVTARYRARRLAEQSP